MVKLFLVGINEIKTFNDLATALPAVKS